MSKSIYEIKDTLVEDSYSLKDLCQSDNINYWSFYKPINTDKVDYLKDIDFYNVNDGFRIWGFASPQQMVYALQNPNNTNIWQYIPRTAPFRLLDFDSYVHNASPMFNIEISNSDTGGPGDLIRMCCNNDILEFIHRWKIFEGNRTNLDVIALFYPVGTQYNDTPNKGIHIYKIYNTVISDIDSEKLDLIIPNGLADWQYEIRICISTEIIGLEVGQYMYYSGNGDPINALWFPLPPHSYVTANFTSSGGGGGGGGGGGSIVNFLDYVDFSFENLNYNYSEPYLTNLSFNLRTMLQNTRDETVHVSGTLIYENSYRPVQIGQFSATLNLSDEIYKLFEISYNDVITTMTAGHLDEGIISIRIKAHIEINNIHQYPEWTENVEM